jgi:putative addiction module component (TIGR02574 family)
VGLFGGCRVPVLDSKSNLGERDNMPPNAADLLNDALALPQGERARIARALIDSLDEDDAENLSPAEIESAWRAEIERREEEIEHDPNVLIPADQVFAEARNRLLAIREVQGRHRRSG